MSTLSVTNISDGTNSTATTNVVKGSAKAWVNFNGTGTVAIRRAYNVSSITDEGTGKYTVNFTTAMADADYVPQVTSGPNNSAVGGIFGEAASYNDITTTDVYIAFIVHTGSIVDTPYAFVAVYS